MALYVLVLRIPEYHPFVRRITNVPSKNWTPAPTPGPDSRWNGKGQKELALTVGWSNVDYTSTTVSVYLYFSEFAVKMKKNLYL